MSGSESIVRDLYRMPGDRELLDREILNHAVAAYDGLLSLALVDDAGDRGNLVAALVAALNQLGRKKYQWLCHPLLIEGLHGVRASPSLQRWHQSVALPSASSLFEPVADSGDLLGNILLALSLRKNPNWKGEEWLSTDLTGRLRFPASDWSIIVFPAEAGQQNAFVRKRVKALLEDDQACLSLDDSVGPFLYLSREDALRIVSNNDENLSLHQFATPNAEVRARLQYATPLCSGSVRYDPIYFTNFEAHAGYTGAIVNCVLEAIRFNSPSIHREFCHLMYAVRGFELPESPAGTVGSFSDPTYPRVMGINVPYSLNNEPRLSPFCFQWFGHELAHTKTYLINDIAYFNGWTVIHNPADFIPCIPRYGRPLSVRTVFQIPYTHFYEWTLLMDFMENGFDTLPWEVNDDPLPVGDDLELEITEAFDLINSYARLTNLGVATVTHLWQLFSVVRSRWRSVRARWHGSHRVAAVPNPVKLAGP